MQRGAARRVSTLSIAAEDIKSLPPLADHWKVARHLDRLSA